MWTTTVIGIITVAVYLALAPAVVNGDGLGYLKAALADAVYPGHLAYVPLLTKLARGLGATRPIDLLWPARMVSAAAAGLAVATLGALARRRFCPAAGVAAALGLLASWGLLSAGSDVESYAPALAALLGAFYFAERQWPLAAGLWCALATLFHLENALLLLPLGLLVQGRRARLTLWTAATLPLAACYAPLAWRHGLAWLGGASHGLHYPVRAVTPLVALYGACKALVYAPYPYEASWARVLGCFFVGLAALAVLGSAMRWPLPRPVVLAWAVPYALVGALFYGSDAERWTFLLPLVWWAAAARPRRALAVAGGLAVANLALWLPVARDQTVRRQAATAAVQMATGDLAIGPGHGWDEYVGFWRGPQVTVLPLVYWAGAVGRARLGGVVAQAVAQARAQGHAVWLLRLDNARDPNGWKELRQFDLGVRQARALLPPGRAVRIGDGIERWEPLNRAQTKP